MGGPGEAGEWWPVSPWLTDEQADPGKTDERGDGVMDGLGAARVAGQLQGAKGLAHKTLRCGWRGNRACAGSGLGLSMLLLPSPRKTSSGASSTMTWSHSHRHSPPEPAHCCSSLCPLVHFLSLNLHTQGTSMWGLVWFGLL